jgi:hypothetical protein
MSLGGWLRRRWYLLVAGLVADACEAPAGCEELARWNFLDPGSGRAYCLCTTHAHDPATVDGLVPMHPVRQRR